MLSFFEDEEMMISFGENSAVTVKKSSQVEPSFLLHLLNMNEDFLCFQKLIYFFSKSSSKHGQVKCTGSWGLGQQKNGVHRFQKDTLKLTSYNEEAMRHLLVHL